MNVKKVKGYQPSRLTEVQEIPDNAKARTVDGYVYSTLEQAERARALSEQNARIMEANQKKILDQISQLPGIVSRVDMRSNPPSGKEVKGATTEIVGTRYNLIPWDSIKALGDVYHEGTIKYPHNAVNGKSLRAGDIDWITREWVIERYEHCMEHMRKWLEGDTSEDHLAKIMWFGSTMRAIERIANKVYTE